MAVSGILNWRSQEVQTAKAGVVPIHLITRSWRFSLVMTDISSNSSYVQDGFDCASLLAARSIPLPIDRRSVGLFLSQSAGTSNAFALFLLWSFAPPNEQKNLAAILAERLSGKVLKAFRQLLCAG
jgi:hypothetical protein